MPNLRTEAIIPLPKVEVFQFFAKAENLETITPPFLHFQIVSPLPIRMGEGTLIEYRLRVFGIPQRWRSRISQWNPPCGFADEQINGPYRHWFHTHSFEEYEHGTKMVDSVDYALPFGRLGKIAHPFVRTQLKAIFRYRNKTIGNVLPIPSGKGVVRGPVLIQ